MSFLQTAYGGGSHKERFSLLSLSPEEIYFNDFSVLYVRTHPKTQTTEIIKGRLKICSQSVIFDTKIFAVPNIKFPLENIVEIKSITNEWTDANNYSGKTISIRTSLTVEMKENNVISPYKFKEASSSETHMYVLTHSQPEDCLPLLQQLHRAAMAKIHGDISDGKFMIQAITLSMSSRMSFDLTQLVDSFERPVLEMDGVRIGPLVKNPGKILLTQTRMYFQAFNNVDAGEPIVVVRTCDIKSARRRRVLMRHVGLEIAYSGQSQSPKLLFLQFHNMADRDQICTHIAKIPSVVIDCSDEKNMLIKWQTRAISNYEYLEYLNSVADRSFNDLTQYPVFPWLVADYTSETLDLTDPATFRDLSKPIGALNPKRLNLLKERYEDMVEPKFLYGSHYSTPGDVLFYLARAAPEYTLCLHNGKFDQPDRMFRSVADTWENLMKSTSDFKELIPEFYQTKTSEDGEEPGLFLNNYMIIDFGKTQDGEKIGDVSLPPWAESSRDFVFKLREALESEHVSSNLHYWIDLIFGYKQRGEEAFRANNIFFHLTYEGAVDLDNLPNTNERASIEAQINEFGQTPRQLFFAPHPARDSPDPDESLADADFASKAYDILMAEKVHRGDDTDSRDVITTLTSPSESMDDEDQLCDKLCGYMKVHAVRPDRNQNISVRKSVATPGVMSARFRRDDGAHMTSSLTSSMIEERDEETSSFLSSLAQLRQVARHNLHKK